MSHTTPPQCLCAEEAVVFTVKKPGPNNNRQFYTCAGYEPNKCKFFKWADEPVAKKQKTSHTTKMFGGNTPRLQQNITTRRVITGEEEEEQPHHVCQCQDFMQQVLVEMSNMTVLIKEMAELITEYKELKTEVHDPDDFDDSSQ